jgi:hypothetical protein
MKLKINKHMLKILLTYVLIIIAIVGTGLSAQSSVTLDKNQEQKELQKLFLKVKRAVQTQNYNILQNYVSRKNTLYWAQCNTDVSIDLAFDKLINELKKNSKDVDIVVADHIKYFIETEGWTGEYPYLYFQFTKVNNNWQWLGVCYDYQRSLDYRLALGGMDKYYDTPPQLPRRGPRVFEDIIALQVRIIEILKFKKFDALTPYARRKKVFIGKGCPTNLDKADLVRIGSPVEQAIEFMEKNSVGAKEITPEHNWSYNKRYFISNGWTGEKPAITFCFEEGEKGWEWTGISY